MFTHTQIPAGILIGIAVCQFGMNQYLSYVVSANLFSLTLSVFLPPSTATSLCHMRIQQTGSQSITKEEGTSLKCDHVDTLISEFKLPEL